MKPSAVRPKPSLQRYDANIGARWAGQRIASWTAVDWKDSKFISYAELVSSPFWL